MESEAREGDEASVQTEKETEGGGEWGTLRLRRNEEIREELAAVEKMEKVSENSYYSILPTYLPSYVCGS